MSVNFLLLCFLAILMWKIGGSKGWLALTALGLNLLFMFIMLILINWGFSPVILTIITSLIITSMNLFFINGLTTKTIVAFFSSAIILIFMVFLIYICVNFMQLQGLPTEELMEMDMYSLNIGISFLSLSISVMIMSAVGAINDIAISVSAAIGELHQSNNELTKDNLFNSGMIIGKDILSSTMNTIIFALIGGQIALFIWVSDLNYSFAHFINTKILVSQWVTLLISGIAITLTIPITSYLMIYRIKKTDVST
ncbi:MULTISPECIES: YibE/F family protein [Vagococcus]|uniref:Integral membrane protein n=1 Tax=Vagococcus fluvialis bH819 TaxID=1255619 RepID=A0A1X6WS47_9ENTE|nr:MULTISPECIES: YibE/F family protein [Vagococcus]SLM86466.1 Integral membrane protein [Vagococcus fluvialis bH819]HCM90674.1 YibE/F family protein [Vagococcus sp.]